jgi:hypothetical protein
MRIKSVHPVSLSNAGGRPIEARAGLKVAFWMKGSCRIEPVHHWQWWRGEAFSILVKAGLAKQVSGATQCRRRWLGRPEETSSMKQDLDDLKSKALQTAWRFLETGAYGKRRERARSYKVSNRAGSSG